MTNNIWIAGIDTSSKKLAITITPLADSSDIVMRRYMLSEGNKALACAQAYASMLKFVREYQMDDLRIFMEYPISFRSGTSTVILSRIHGAATAGIIRGKAQLHDVNNQAWKKVVVSPIHSGRIGKTEIASAVQTVWPKAFGLANGDQDLLDSAAINLYGRAVVEKAEKIRHRGTTQRKVRRSA